MYLAQGESQKDLKDASSYSTKDSTNICNVATPRNVSQSRERETKKLETQKNCMLHKNLSRLSSSEDLLSSNTSFHDLNVLEDLNPVLKKKRLNNNEPIKCEKR